MASSKDWRPARVLRTAKGADDMLSLVIKPDEWLAHKAGQHYELRLPGHHLSRKYSIVSSPLQKGELEFGIQLLPTGEVSPRLWKLKPGDALDIRGPLGSFVWQPERTGPLLLVGAGSGITPLLSMYHHFCSLKPKAEAVFVLSAKHEGRVLHYPKLKKELITRFTTKDGRVDYQFLAAALQRFASNPQAHCFICGPGSFNGFVLDALYQMGFSDDQIDTEMFS